MRGGLTDQERKEIDAQLSGEPMEARLSQCHGITNARRIVGEKTRDTQRVTICDGDGEVVLEISSTWPSGLTSDQARYVARLLCEAADRVDEATAEALRAMDEEEAANVAAREDKNTEVQAT